MLNPLAILDRLNVSYHITSNVRKSNPKSHHYTGQAYDITINDPFYFSFAIILFDIFHPGGLGVSRNACRHIHIDSGARRRFEEVHLNPNQCTKNFYTKKISIFPETILFFLVLFPALFLIFRKK